MPQNRPALLHHVAMFDGSRKLREAFQQLLEREGFRRPLDCCKSRKGWLGGRLCAKLTSACWVMLPHALSSSHWGSAIAAVPDASFRRCHAACCRHHATNLTRCLLDLCYKILLFLE